MRCVQLPYHVIPRLSILQAKVEREVKKKLAARTRNCGAVDGERKKSDKNVVAGWREELQYVCDQRLLRHTTHPFPPEAGPRRSSPTTLPPLRTLDLLPECPKTQQEGYRYAPTADATRCMLPTSNMTYRRYSSRFSQIYGENVLHYSDDDRSRSPFHHHSFWPSHPPERPRSRTTSVSISTHHGSDWEEYPKVAPMSSSSLGGPSPIASPELIGRVTGYSHATTPFRGEERSKPRRPIIDPDHGLILAPQEDEDIEPPSGLYWRAPSGTLPCFSRYDDRYDPLSTSHPEL
jgi:hypothetical protein